MKVFKPAMMKGTTNPGKFYPESLDATGAKQIICDAMQQATTGQSKETRLWYNDEYHLLDQNLKRLKAELIKNFILLDQNSN